MTFMSIKTDKTMRIERNTYLNQLIESQNNGLIKIITGIRRCGKSYLLFNIYYDYLISKGIDNEHIIKIALDDILNEEYKDPRRLLLYIKESIKDSNNYQKTRIRIAKVYSKIKNSRKHNMIHIVNKIVKEHDIVVSEKLKVKDMSSNHNLSKNILDASFNKICETLKWKCKLQGKYYYQVDIYFPSSKKCSRCDNKTKATLDLSVRNWICEKCGNENDRDINASINIMFEGLKLYYQN